MNSKYLHRECRIISCTSFRSHRRARTGKDGRTVWRERTEGGGETVIGEKDRGEGDTVKERERE